MTKDSIKQQLGNTEFDDNQSLIDEKLETDCSLWPVLSKQAVSSVSIVEDIIDAATANNEVDPVSFLMTLLSGFGASVGSNPHIRIADTLHPPRISTILVGGSSRARKGTSTATILRLLKMAEDEAKLEPLVITNGPLSSGEGLINAVRDPNPDAKPPDVGINDKRLWCIEEEFASVLNVSKRVGNTLSTILRSAWDGGKINPLTRHQTICATNPHICILGHITIHELKIVLNNTEVFNGFANRFLWACVQRKQTIPFPSSIDETIMNHLAKEMGNIILQSRKLRELKFNKNAHELWQEKYPEISEDLPGFLGAITARSEAHTMRLSLVLALLDGKTEIEQKHLEGALAISEYNINSCKFLFGGIPVDRDVEKIIQALEVGPKTTTELHSLFSGHMKSDMLRELLNQLQTNRRIKGQKFGGGQGMGKAGTKWELIRKK
jgi:hypothetical protein